MQVRVYQTSRGIIITFFRLITCNRLAQGKRDQAANSTITLQTPWRAGTITQFTTINNSWAETIYNFCMERNKFRARIWGKLMLFCRKNNLFKKGGKVLLAVSGGPDSVCMAHFLAQYSRRHSLGLVLCHVNHGIRGKAAKADEMFVIKLGKKLGLKTVIRRASAPALAGKNRLSLEHAARKLRYSLLEKTALENKCSAVATAHHLDDHVETFLLNLIRGTNPKGLAGIPVKRLFRDRKKKAVKNISVIRPLLCLEKWQILEYLRQNGLSFQTDATNESEKFTRNWVRKQLLPLIEKKQPQFRDHILALSAGIQALLSKSHKRDS